jgi:hypothetical protein
MITHSLPSYRNLNFYPRHHIQFTGKTSETALEKRSSMKNAPVSGGSTIAFLNKNKSLIAIMIAGITVISTTICELYGINDNDYDRKRTAISDYLKACYDCLQGRTVSQPDKITETKQNLIKATLNLQLLFNFQKTKERARTLNSVKLITDQLLRFSPYANFYQCQNLFNNLGATEHDLLKILWEYEPSPIRRWKKNLKSLVDSKPVSANGLDLPAPLIYYQF